MMFFVFLFLVYFIHFFGSLVGSMRFFFRLIVLFGLLLFLVTLILITTSWKSQLHFAIDRIKSPLKKRTKPNEKAAEIALPKEHCVFIILQLA